MKNVLPGMTALIFLIFVIYEAVRFIRYGNGWARGAVSFKKVLAPLFVLLITIFAASWVLFYTLLD